MDQVTTGIRSILSRPVVYDTFQRVLGDVSARTLISRQYIRAKPGDVVVDIGCGTAELLNYLPDGIRYFGFDLSPSYIEAARTRHRGRESAEFRCADLAKIGPGEIPPCDVAISFGVLHHVNDADATALLEQVHRRLAPGGRVVTIDNAFVAGQHFIARELIKRDRGQHVRTPDGYLALVPACYGTRTISVHHDLLRVPYTHAIMECERGNADAAG